MACCSIKNQSSVSRLSIDKNDSDICWSDHDEEDDEENREMIENLNDIITANEENGNAITVICMKDMKDEDLEKIDGERNMGHSDDDIKRYWRQRWGKILRKCELHNQQPDKSCGLNRRWNNMKLFIRRNFFFWRRPKEATDVTDFGGSGRFVEVKDLKKFFRLLTYDSIGDIRKYRGVDIGTMERCISQADVNNDGKISEEEFVNLMLRLEKEGDKSDLSNMKKVFTAIAFADSWTFWPPPLFIIFISLWEVSMLIYHQAYYSHYFPLNSSKVPLCSQWIYNPERRFEIWRFITYAFVHEGLTHIFTNLFLQILIGLFLEISHASWRVAIVYFMGILAGSLGSSIFDPKIALVGASGGVYALATAHVASMILNWREDSDVFVHRKNKDLPTKATNHAPIKYIRLAIIMILILADFGISVYERYVNGNKSVSYAAHIGGAVTGFFIGMRVLKLRHSFYKKDCFAWISLVIIILFILFGIFINVVGNERPFGLLEYKQFYNTSDCSWEDYEHSCQISCYHAEKTPNNCSILIC